MVVPLVLLPLVLLMPLVLLVLLVPWCSRSMILKKIEKEILSIKRNKFYLNLEVYLEIIEVNQCGNKFQIKTFRSDETHYIHLD